MLLDQYVALLGASAQGGAQAMGDAMLLLQSYLIGGAAILAAVLVALLALISPPFAEQLEVAAQARAEERERAWWQREWERVLIESAARDARAAPVARPQAQREQRESNQHERQDQHLEDGRLVGEEGR